MIKAAKTPHTLHFSVLPSFTRFVESNHISEFASLKVQMAKAYQLPFLKYFGEFTDDEVKDIFAERTRQLLSALSENKGEEYIQAKRDQWLSGQLHTHLKKNDVHLADVILLGFVRKKLLLRFAATFTKDVDQYHKLNEEIEAFFVRYNLVFSEAFLQLLNEQKEQKTQLEERERKLKLAMEATGVGICEYNLVTGKILASESCRTIFGWSKDKQVTFDDFLARIEEEQRDEVANNITEGILGERKLFEAEFPITREDGEKRWLRAQGKIVPDELGIPVQMIGTIMDITEAKSTEKQLLASEQQFRQLADCMPQLIWEATIEGRITYFNKKWIEYTGVTVVMGEHWGVVHPDDIPVTRLFWEVSLATGTTYDAELRLKDVRGNFRWFLARAVPMKDDAGNIMRWLGTCTDVHDQKLADESLKLQGRVLESMDEGVVISDKSGTIRFTNKAEDSIFGYQPGELTGQHITMLSGFTQDVHNRVVGEMVASLREKGYWHGEWLTLRKDGSKFYCSSHVSTLKLGNEKLFVTVQRDITEEKKTRHVKEETEARFRRLADDAPMFVWMADKQVNVTYCNKELLNYFGFSDYTQITGKVWETLVHPEDIAKLYFFYANALQYLKTFSTEIRIRDVNGEHRWFAVRGTPRIDNGKVDGFIGTAADVHEQKLLNSELEKRVQERTEELLAANEHLEQSNRELEQFAYVASHDLKEPLRKIQTFGDILMTKYGATLNGDGSALIEKMRGASERMKVLIEDLLAYSTVSSADDAKKFIDLNTLVREVLSDLETTTREKEAIINVSTLEPIEGNELLLRQLFQNILCNSLKFSKVGLFPLIDITSQKTTGKASGIRTRAEDQDKVFQLITITDNGIGFEQKLAEEIFELFNRLNVKADYAGTGIGLSTAKKAVEKHEGYIRAEGIMGKGATFKILLPYS